MDAVIAYLPHPLDIPNSKGTDPRTGEDVHFPVDPEAPLPTRLSAVVCSSASGTNGKYVLSCRYADCKRKNRLQSYRNRYDKEAITQPVEHRHVFKKQTGGRGKFADIIFRMEPAEEGKEGLTFVNEGPEDSVLKTVT